MCYLILGWIVNHMLTWSFGEQEWCSGESSRLPPMWPGFDSRPQRHAGWVIYLFYFLFVLWKKDGKFVSSVMKWEGCDVHCVTNVEKQRESNPWPRTPIGCSDHWACHIWTSKWLSLPQVSRSSVFRAPEGVQKVMASISVGDSDFSLKMNIASSHNFCFVNALLLPAQWR